MNEKCKARPHDDLIREVLDSYRAKSKREHAAVREIRRLREKEEIASGAFADEHARNIKLRAEVRKFEIEAQRWLGVVSCGKCGGEVMHIERHCEKCGATEKETIDLDKEISDLLQRSGMMDGDEFEKIALNPNFSNEYVGMRVRAFFKENSQKS